MMHEDLYLSRYRLMLKYQAQIAPFTPTIRELSAVWYLGNTPTHYTLTKLVQMGLCIVRSHGKTKSYYAVKQ